MKRTFEVLIAGAGLAGLTAAALLAKSAERERLNLRVVDAGKRPQFDLLSDVSLRVSAIAAGSSRLYSSLGVWDAVLGKRACPFRAMRVWDASRSVDGPGTLRFDAADFAVPELGSIVENVLLQDALLGVLDAAGVAVSFETPIGALQPAGDRFTVVFADGQSVTPELVIGADGAASLIRRQAGIAAVPRHYRQSAFVMHLRPEKAHRNIAWQRFLPGGPIALLPLSDGRVSVVWSTSDDEAKEASGIPLERLGERLSEASDRVLGALTPAGPRASFPLMAQHAARYVRPGLALIGDAAHSIHPLAGQGANLGIADAAVLAKVVREAVALGDFPGDWPVLRRYERSRKASNMAMSYFVDGLNRLFTSRSVPLSALRTAGMTLFNHSGPVRRRAVEVALGVGDNLAAL